MRHVTALAAAAALLFVARPVLAQDGETDWPEWETGSLAIGGFIADLDNTVRIGAPGVGVEVDLEDTLGLDRTQAVYRIDGTYRFGISRRHQVGITWFDLSRAATRTLETQIEIDGVVYPIGTTVHSVYDLQFLNASYSYSFVLDDRVDLAASFGLHITDVGLHVEEPLRGTTGDGWTAPLPLIGARLDVAITPNFYLRSHAKALWVKYGDIEGRVSDLLFAGEFRGWKNFAVGIGLNSVDLFIESRDWGGFNGRIETDFVGLMLYGKALF